VKRNEELLSEALDHLDAGRLVEAESICRRILKQAPRDGNAARVLCNVLILRGRGKEALAMARKAGANADHHPAFYWSLGRLMRQIGTPSETVELFRKAVELEPREPEGWIALTEALIWAGDFEAARREAARGLSFIPSGAPELHLNYATALISLGRAEEALRVLRAASDASPGHIQLAALLASALNVVADAMPEEVFAAHRRVGEAIEKAHGPVPQRPPLRRPMNDPVRVGLLSPDLRTHSVSYFVEPLLRHIDRALCEIVCFSTSVHEDATSERLAAMASGWRNLALHSDDHAAEVIRAESIDVLIDLAGLTAGNRPGILHRRPAPVMATWLGYPNTTGMRFIDVRMVDSLTDPPGAERFCVERLVRLDPCFMCYAPPQDAPAPAPAPPVVRNGFITFGSFNAHRKTNDATLALWARLLHAVPRSRLLMKNASLGAPNVRADVLYRLERLGIAADRVELLGPSPTVREHLASYGRMDIALDTFPYHGATTTCEALWMGVPVVTLVGRTHASRVGLSLLSAAGFGQWAAADEDSFARIASELAKDRGRLSELRSRLRASIAESPLCDGTGFARRFAAMIRVTAMAGEATVAHGSSE